MDVLQGSITVKGENIPPQQAIEIEQYINETVNQYLFDKYNASVRVHLSYTDSTSHTTPAHTTPVK